MCEKGNSGMSGRLVHVDEPHTSSMACWWSHLFLFIYYCITKLPNTQQFKTTAIIVIVLTVSVSLEFRKYSPGKLAQGLSLSRSLTVVKAGMCGTEAWLSIEGCSCNLTASPRGLFAWASLGFLPAWQAQGSWTAYVKSGGFKMNHPLCSRLGKSPIVTSSALYWPKQWPKPVQFQGKGT